MLSKSLQKLEILDGSMGLYLFRIGLPKNIEVWSAISLLDSKYHSLVVDAHKTYLRCGSTVITTNNYSCIPFCLEKVNKLQEMENLIKISVKLAEIAKKEYIRELSTNEMLRKQNKHQLIGKGIRIAGSIPPLMESYRADLVLSEQQSIYYYSRIVHALCAMPAIIDILLCETLSALSEAKYALTAILCHRSQMTDVWVSFSLQENGCLRSGESMNFVIAELESWMEMCNICMIPMNCCTPESIDNCLKSLTVQSLDILDKHSVYIGLYPNGTHVIKDDWCLEGSGFNPVRYEFTAKVMFDKFYSKWTTEESMVMNRIGMVGGCCNIEPRHIQYLVQQLLRNSPHLLLPVSKDVNVELDAKYAQLEKEQPLSKL